MSFRRKLLAFGIGSVILAGIGLLMVWTAEKDIRHHVYAKDAPDA